jgi:acid stress-induced BolA-like protein IbaG/YrbA
MLLPAIVEGTDTMVMGDANAEFRRRRSKPRAIASGASRMMISWRLDRASARGYYAVTFVCDRITGLNAENCYGMIYAALGDAMERDIHALAINAYSLAEI